jgi:hypothetical protein
MRGRSRAAIDPYIQTDQLIVVSPEGDTVTAYSTETGKAKSLRLAKSRDNCRRWCPSSARGSRALSEGPEGHPGRCLQRPRRDLVRAGPARDEAVPNVTGVAASTAADLCFQSSKRWCPECPGVCWAGHREHAIISSTMVTFTSSASTGKWEDIDTRFAPDDGGPREPPRIKNYPRDGGGFRPPAERTVQNVVETVKGLPSGTDRELCQLKLSPSREALSAAGALFLRPRRRIWNLCTGVDKMPITDFNRCRLVARPAQALIFAGRISCPTPGPSARIRSEMANTARCSRVPDDKFDWQRTRSRTPLAGTQATWRTYQTGSS